MEAASKHSGSLSEEVIKADQKSRSTDDSGENSIKVAINLPEYSWEDSKSPEPIHRIERPWADII